ncbi:hypothetical protein LQ757_04560 [Agromyces sp. SYSU K20354]|uniref:hypothetical protein n=1 Tax=Agromyces cavernae TaxID=2898659 RepID=UPI001E36C352|nr:hypothetical protein [Agromyces cavernae]MCD2441546.1 hypothetical protein [Agromyces cavernae]
MAEHRPQDPRLTLTAAGFVGDAEAQDGVHLRWSFDPDLGFPVEGFTLWHRRADRGEQRKVSFAHLAQQLETQPAPAGVEGGVTVHRADGERLVPGRRCGQAGLELGDVPLVLRFRPSFGSAPSPTRSVTLFGLAERGGVSVRALHAGRVSDCAAVGRGACLRRLVGSDVAGDLSALDAAEFMLPGRHARTRRRAGIDLMALLRADRRDALDRLEEIGFQPAATSCTPFRVTVDADAIDEVRVSGCAAVVVGALWSPIPADDCERDWKRLEGPILLPVGGDARDVARSRLPDEADLPPDAPRRADLEARLLGPDFDELRTALEQAVAGGGQFIVRLASDDPDDESSWRYDVVRDVLTAAADPYFARVVGLAFVHRPDDDTERYDYKVEAGWPIDGEHVRLCWVAYDRGLEAQPGLPAPIGVAATARPGAAHVGPDGVLNPFEMDVTVAWRRPTACDLTDPVRSPIAYLVERTDADAPDAGPYRLVSRRVFEPGGEPEVVPAVIADPESGDPAFASGFFVDRGPGYGTFHYRVRGRDLFGRTSIPSGPAGLLVRDEVAPGPPLNLAAEYAAPDDPDRSGSALLAWANRDVAPGAPRRSAVLLRWTWPASRQLQFPDLDEFRLYLRPGALNHVLGRIEGVTAVAPGEFEVATDLAPVGPDFPVPQAGVDLGALRSEGEDCPVVTITTVGGALTFRVRANPAAPPLVGPTAFRLGRGTSPTATHPARSPHPAFRSFEWPVDWEGFLVEPVAPPRALRVAVDGSVRGPLPDGLTPADVDVTRVSEPVDGQVHWHYRMTLRGVSLEPTRERPRAVASFGIGSVDAAGNQGRIAPPASAVAVHRAPPEVPQIVYPPVNLATAADYHGASWFTVEWPGEAGVGYQVYRAADLDLLAVAGIDLADHRARPDHEQRLQLQQLALDPSHVEAFRIVTATPVPGLAGPTRHRDALPGAVRNRFVYRVRAVDSAGNLAPWPPASIATCVVVDVPGLPPAAPSWADVAFPASGGVELRWHPDASPALHGYRLYRTDDVDRAEDVRSMAPLFAAPQEEGGGVVTGVVLARNATGVVTSVMELPPGDRRPGRLARYVDATVRPGHPTFYRLVAEDDHGRRSPASERLRVVVPVTGPPEPPAWAAPPTLAPGSVSLTWTADDPGLRCLVLRRSGDGAWRALGPWAAAGDYAFTDTTAVAGTGYQYRVRVRDAVGHTADGPIVDVTGP